MRTREEKEREAGNQEPSVDDETGTIHAQENELEPVAVDEPNAVEGLDATEKPDEEPVQESVAGQKPAAVDEPTAVQDENKAGKKEEIGERLRQIVQQPITYEQFKFISKHTACASGVELMWRTGGRQGVIQLERSVVCPRTE